jgi:hypothetical protein
MQLEKLLFLNRIKSFKIPLMEEEEEEKDDDDDEELFGNFISIYSLVLIVVACRALQIGGWIYECVCVCVYLKCCDKWPLEKKGVSIKSSNASLMWKITNSLSITLRAYTHSLSNEKGTLKVKTLDEQVFGRNKAAVRNIPPHLPTLCESQH